MSATVTGGAGFIGSHLVDTLAKRGTEHVRVIDDLRWLSPRWDTDGVEPDYMQAWPRRVTVDRSSVADATFPHADVIYHLAGPVGPVGVLGWSGRIVEMVVEDALRVARVAKRDDAVLVYVSTSEVYGAHDGPTDETSARIIQAGYSARMEYAVAKLAAETMLLGLANTEGIDIRIVRPFNVAGPRQRTEGGFVLPRFIEQARAGEPLTVYQPGTQHRAFTHVLDMAEGLVAVAEQGRPGGVYNLGNAANECSILELAEQVIRVSGSSSTIDIIDPVSLWGVGFREAPDKIPEARKAIEELGWKPYRDRLQVIVDCLL